MNQKRGKTLLAWGMRVVTSMQTTPVLALLLASVVAAVLVPSALAKEYELLTTTLGSPGSGAGQMKEPEGVAVDGATHDVFVADTGNHRVDEFTEAGEFVRTWGKDVNKTKVGFGTPEEDDVCTQAEVEMGVECQAGASGKEAGEFEDANQIAVDEATGDVYVTDPGPLHSGFEADEREKEVSRIERFSSEGAYLGATEPAGTCKNTGETPPKCIGYVAFYGLRGVAVDPSGDLWVYDNDLFEEHKVGVQSGQVAEFDGTGKLAEAYNTERFTYPNRRYPSLGRGSLAIDPHGGLYLINENGAVSKWTAAKQELVENFGEEETSYAVAVNPSTGNVLIAKAVTEGNPTSRVELYKPYLEGESEPRPVETFPAASEPLSETYGIGVSGSSNDVFVSERGLGEVVVFGRTSGATPPIVETEAPTEVSLTALTLNGRVGPAGEKITACEFEYGPEEEEPGEYPHEAACSPAAPFTGVETVSAEITGLEEGHTYHYRLTATNEVPLSAWTPDRTVSTLSATVQPVVANEAASAVGPSEATVGAEIDPGGLPTTYWVQYVTKAQFESSGFAEAVEVPADASEKGGFGVGGGKEAQSVEVALNGLKAGEEYEFHFVAENNKETTEGSGAGFQTTGSTGASSSVPPDGRAYELVSNAPAAGTGVYTPSTALGSSDDAETPYLFEAEANAGAVAYVGEPASAAGNGAIGAGLGDTWLSKRTTGGWNTAIITPTRGEATSDFPGVDFQAFSGERLSQAIVQSSLQPVLAEDAPAECRQVLYTRDDVNDSYDPLFTAGSIPGPCGEGHPEFAGGTPGDSQVIFEDEASLVEGVGRATEVPPGHEGSHTGQSNGEATGEPCEFGCNLYDSRGGRLELVNRLPNGGGVATSATFGGLSDSNDASRADFSGAISSAGSRIFWTDTQAGANMEHVFVFENNESEKPVSREGPESYPAEYWTATPDGRYAYYTEGGELHRFNSEPEGGEPEREALTNGHGIVGIGDLRGRPQFKTGPEGESEEAEAEEVTSVAAASSFSVGLEIYGAGIVDGTRITNVDAAEHKLELSNPAYATASGIAITAGGSEVQGVIGVNTEGEDGTHVYFVANGVLTATGNPRGERPSQGDCTPPTNAEAENETCNLYVLHERELSFVATLSGVDDDVNIGENVSGGDWRPSLSERTAQVTPDGNYLVFESIRPVTGYDNLDEGTKQPVEEVFEYTATGGGQLTCVSCTPTGTRPGVIESRLSSLLTVSSSNTYMPRWVSKDGARVFFGTLQPLALRDDNGVGDVYEWEAPGEGSCTAQTSSVTGGCTYLISSGSSPYASIFVDASANGDDVFFTTRSDLVPSDRGEAIQLYDARQCTETAPCVQEAATPCTSAACQGTPSAPPTFSLVESTTITGTDDFSPAKPTRPPPAPTLAQKLEKALQRCRRDRAKRTRVMCEKRARKRYGATKKHGATKKRATSRPGGHG
ncbi:MAG TPA: hypothetical protein VL979_15365 [Solirubrobacteraceae bacterium]|nr:hypothetical protein [Solirubrobacteraceae bacterium]